MSDLLRQKCEACRAGAPPATPAEISELKRQTPGWGIVEEEGIPRLRRVFKFQDFAGALAFAVKVGEAADGEDHHPAVLIEWGLSTVTWWTHKIRGLHRNDFIMAAKTDEIYRASNPAPSAR